MSHLGARRHIPEFRGPQTCLGSCAVCGQAVWVYDDEPRKDEPLVHGRTCAPGGPFYEQRKAAT